MKKGKMVAVSALLTLCIMGSSCIGSHALFNKLSAWNKGASDNKFINELICFAMWVIPVYQISLLGDVIVFNSIEFWTGSNPMANVGSVKNVKGSDGKEYCIKTEKDGYKISQDGKSVDLKFNEKDQSWNVESNGKSHKLLKMNQNGTAALYLGNRVMNVTLDAQGVTAARSAAMDQTYAMQ